MYLAILESFAQKVSRDNSWLYSSKVTPDSRKSVLNVSPFHDLYCALLTYYVSKCMAEELASD